MDPYTLAKVLWRHRLLALPAVVLVLLGGLYVVMLGPRTYEASAVYVVVNPNPPTDREIERDSRLGRLNDDNPYIRAADPSLIVKVLVAKMSSQSVQLALQSTGLSTEYTVAPSPLSQMTIIITASAPDAAGAKATRQWLLDNLVKQLYDLQKVNGANDRYLFNALPVDVGVDATEKISSRLRSLILVMAAGVVLIVAVVSIAAARDRQKETRAQDDAAGAPEAPSQGVSQQTSRSTGDLKSAKGVSSSTGEMATRSDAAKVRSSDSAENGGGSAPKWD